MTLALRYRFAKVGKLKVESLKRIVIGKLERGMGTRLRQTKLAFGRMESWKGNGAEASSLQKRERVKVGRLEGWKVGRLEGNGAEASSLQKR